MEVEPQNQINNSEKRGPGRPKGSSNKLKIWQFVTPDEVTELVELAKEEAQDGKTDMLKFLLEQIFGKARQNVGLDGGEDGTPVVFMPSEIADKNNIQTQETTQ